MRTFKMEQRCHQGRSEMERQRKGIGGRVVQLSQLEEIVAAGVK